jgi:hypothetical protein
MRSPWLGGCYDDAQRSRAFVERLVLLAGGYLDSVSWFQDEVVVLNFDGEFAFEDPGGIRSSIMLRSGVPGRV